MCRPFVVEGEAVALVADFIRAALDFKPAEGVRFAHADWFFLAVGRGKWIAEQNVFDIHQGKFLMLLFVMYPEFQQVRCSSESFVFRGQHKRPYRRVDMGEVPFCPADIRHRLNLLVLDG